MGAPADEVGGYRSRGSPAGAGVSWNRRGCGFVLPCVTPAETAMSGKRVVTIVGTASLDPTMNVRSPGREPWYLVILAIAALAVVVGCGEASPDTPAASTADGETESMMTDNERLEDALRRHAAALSVEIGDRTPFQPEKLARAADYIRGVFEQTGLEVTEQAYDYHDVRVANLIAEPAGAATTAPYYLIGAHYETVPGTPGADDTASGVAVLLELARRIAARTPPVPLRFAAFTLEEPPAHATRFQGSRVFVKELADSGGRVLGAIILEMVGFTAPKQAYPVFLHWAGYPKEGNFIGVVGNWRSRRFGRAVLRGLRKNPRLPVESLFVPLNGWVLPDTRLSDHASFWDRGWPALMITDTAFFRNPNYHTSHDTFGTLDFAFMAELVRSLEHALDELPSAR